MALFRSFRVSANSQSIRWAETRLQLFCSAPVGGDSKIHMPDELSRASNDFLWGPGADTDSGAILADAVVIQPDKHQCFSYLGDDSQMDKG
jgi:hypothetical protein